MQADSLAPQSAPPARILVVDDQEYVADLVRGILEDQGFAVDTAADGVQALKAVFDRRPDLLILDIMMPRMDGLMLLEHLRQDPALADLRVILLTAKGQEVDITQGYRVGADVYLTKPFHPDELVAFVRRMLLSG
jgi:DNA-binding response OmpR family regulator